jgi:anti-sigma B factor antagonist
MNREFLVAQRGTSVHVLLAGEVDLVSTPALMRALNRALSTRAESVVVNLDAVTFIDSSALSVLVDGHRQAVAAGKAYTIGPPATPAVARVLAVTGLDTGLNVDAEGTAGEATVS